MPPRSPPATLLLRPYRDGDREALCRVHDRAKPLELQGSLDPRAALPLADDPEAADLDESEVIVACLDGELVGFVAIRRACIGWLYVDPDRHRRGVGRALLRAAVERAGDDCWTHVLAANHRARALYASEGFRVVDDPQHVPGAGSLSVTLALDAPPADDTPPALAGDEPTHAPSGARPMSLAASLLPEFDQEFAGLRKALAAVPEERLDWSPHERSFSLRGLVTHLVGMPRWGLLTLAEDELDIDPEVDRNTPVPSLAAALQTFDSELAALRAALAAADDGRLLATWTFKVKGEPRFAMPRLAVLRSFVLNHMIHHRGQLSVCLRLAGAKVPSLYGPTADEPG